MTKHLRLIMLSLLAMICMGGYSQSETDFTTVSWKSPYTFGKYTMTAVKGSGQANPTQNQKDKDIRCYANNKLTVSTKDGKMVKIVFVLSEQGKKQCSQPTVDNGTVKRNPADETQGVSEVIWENSNGSTSVTFTIGSKAVWSKGASSKAGQLCFDKIVITDASSKTPTTTTFGADYDGKTFNFVDGVLEGWKAPTATHTPADVAGTTAYKSDNEAVATFDANGQLTIKDYGKATITATFTPKEEKYAESTASYTVTNTSLQYTSIADLKKVVTADEQSFELKLTNAIVTYVNINNAFIQDESAGIQIYMKGHGLKAENTFTGIVNVKAKLYKGLAQITNWASTVEPTQSEVPEPVVVTLAELTGDNYSKYESVRCKVVGVTVTKGMKVQDGEISQNGTVMAVRGGVKNLTMNEGAILDMIGYPSIFNGTKQFQVWKDSDMTEHQTVKEITLDENSDNIVEAAENVNVTLKRTLYGDGGWNTLCVPFSLTAAQVTAAFGNDVELRKLSSIEGTTLKFVSTDIITAGEPCLIKVAKDGSTYNFEGVATIAVASNTDYTSSMVRGDIQFLGIYSLMDVVTVNPAGPSTGYYAFLGEGNKFFKAQAKTKMKGFRAFFLVPNNVPSNALKAVIDGTATGIEDLVIDGVKANGRVYNLNGQYVGNSLNGLQPGLYIQNGKKIVVK